MSEMKSKVSAYGHERDITSVTDRHSADESFESKSAAEEHLIGKSLSNNCGTARVHHDEDFESESGTEDHGAESYEMKSADDLLPASLTFAQHARIKNGEYSESGMNRTCEKCGKTFTNRNAFVKHVKAHCETYFCEACGKSFNRKGSLKSHNKIHEEKKISCHVCGKEFGSMDEKYTHLKEDHDLKRSKVYSPEFKIDAVKRAKEIGVVNAAKELHIWDSTLVDWQHLIFSPKNCTICGKAFPRKHSLNTHVELVHKNVKSYLCGKCGEGYTSGEAKRNQFSCEKCQDALLTSSSPEGSDAVPVNDADDQQGVNLRELFMETFSFNDDDMLQMLHMRSLANRTDLNCENCNKVFTNRDAFLKHMKTHLEKFECQVCGKTFNRRDILRRHKKTHEQKKTGCHMCGEEFSGMDEKYLHLKEVHNINRSELYSLDFKTHAVKRMKDIGLINAAKELHILQSTLADWYRLVFNPLHCTICGKTFARENKLKDHVDLVHVVTKQDTMNETSIEIKQEIVNNVQVLYIQKYFPTENSFAPGSIEGIVKVEMKGGTCGDEMSVKEEPIDDNEETNAEEIEDENQKFLDTIDSLVAAKNETLTEDSHFIQTMDDGYPCSVCQKTFTTKRGLAKHMIMVHQEKNHCCDICKKAFGRKEHLTRHILDMHNTFDKPYKCDKCDDNFKRKDGLAKHVRFVHNKEANFCCQICTKTFGSNAVLIRHVVDIHEQSGSHVCDFCPKRFSKASNKKSHERKHTGEKPYKCDNCSVSYKGLTCLKKHVKTCLGDSSNKLGMEKQSLEVNIDQYPSLAETKGGNDDEISAKEEPINNDEETIEDENPPPNECDPEALDPSQWEWEEA